LVLTWHLKDMLTGALIGIAIAWALATVVSDAMVRLVIGAIGVSFALNAWFGRPQAQAKQPDVRDMPRGPSRANRVI
jgi:uncharacterized membrane protein YfcA